MLTNIWISTIYIQLITDGFHRFFTLLSWYSKVKKSESLLFQLAVNRD